MRFYSFLMALSFVLCATGVSAQTVQIPQVNIKDRIYVPSQTEFNKIGRNEQNAYLSLNMKPRQNESGRQKQNKGQQNVQKNDGQRRNGPNPNAQNPNMRKSDGQRLIPPQPDMVRPDGQRPTTQNPNMARPEGQRVNPQRSDAQKREVQQPTEPRREVQRPNMGKNNVQADVQILQKQPENQPKVNQKAQPDLSKKEITNEMKDDMLKKQLNRADIIKNLKQKNVNEIRKGTEEKTSPHPVENENKKPLLYDATF